MVQPANHWAYDMLKSLACNSCTSYEELEDLKQIFASEIGSVRKRDRIQSIQDLIDCLERHDDLSEYNIEPIREMADNGIGGEDLHQALRDYCTPKEITTPEPINEYQEMRIAEDLRRKLNIGDNNNIPNANNSIFSSGNSLSVAPPTPLVSANFAATQPSVAPQPQIATLTAIAFTEQKRTAIYKRLSEEMGTSWRSFGRELGISEGNMDEIELQFPRDIKSRVFRLLHLFEEDECNDPRQLVLNLCRALERSRRKDLRRRVEDIMSH